MKKTFATLAALYLLVGPVWAVPGATLKMPYAEAGLSSQQASAHLLSRFSYGARPGEVDQVARQGPESWFSSQLRKPGPDPELESRLSSFPTLKMPLREMADTYLPNNVLLKRAEEQGVIDRKQAKSKDDAEMRAKVGEFARTQGYRSEREMLNDLYSQKMIRVVHARDQIGEVMTDFWFNHFNVSRTKPACRGYILAYERDAIRPYVTGNFRQLLGATAKHPAMLYYLDNAQSVANEGSATLGPTNARARAPQNQGKGKRKRGLNENFARELLELHTLGVDGGYSQKDVGEVARILTGWTAYPSGRARQRIQAQIERAQKMGVPLVVQGDFVFLPALHDAGAKFALGRSFPAGKGMEEGEQVLDLLSLHPSTARTIARKLAVRFVSDKPDPALVDRLAKAYLRSRGEIKPVLETLVESPEFWASASRQAKVKSPLEYWASIARALEADVRSPRPQLLRWFERMGQPLYAYQAPTGFPDHAQQWINSGTLVNRINFAFAVASGKIPGVEVDATRLLSGASGSPEQKLQKAAQQLFVGRDTKATIQQVSSNLKNDKFFESLRKDKEAGFDPSKLSEAQKIVGVLLSSPEFQRR